MPERSAPSPELRAHTAGSEPPFDFEADEAATLAALSSPEPAIDPALATPTEATPASAVAEAIYIIDESKEFAVRAKSAGEHRYNEEMCEARGLRLGSIATRVWKGNLAREYYLNKYTAEAASEIRASDNLYVHEDATKDHDTAAMEQEVGRFASELLDSDERKAELTETGLSAEIKSLVEDYAKGSLAGPAYIEAKNELLQRVAGSNPELMSQGLKFADNLGVVAESIRARVHAGEVLEDIMAATKIYIGEAHLGVRTESRYSAWERMLAKVQVSKVGVLANETVLASALSIATSIVVGGSKKATSVITRVVGFGAGAGLMAGARESKRISSERKQHMRDMAEGKEIVAGSKLREKLEDSRYQTKSALDLTTAMRAGLVELNPETGEMRDKTLTPDGLRLAMASVVEAQMRRDISVRDGIDLIAYSDSTTVAAEKREMYLAQAESKVAITRQFDNFTLEQRAEFLSSLSVEPTAGMDAKSQIEAVLQAQIALLGAETETNISAQDRVFHKLQASEVGKAAIKAALVGAAFGYIAHEAAAGVSHLSGVVDKLRHHGEPAGAHQTLLRHYLEGSEGSKNLMTHSQSLADGTTIDVPTGFHVVGNPNGHGFALWKDGASPTDSKLLTIDSNGKANWVGFGQASAGNLHTELTFANGQPTAETMKMLKAAGINADAKTMVTQTTTSTAVGGNQWMQHHPEQLSSVHRNLWLNNDTQKFDKNELGMWWGGHGNKGVDATGNYSFTVAHMKTGGSFHAGTHVNPAEASGNGRLKLLLSSDKAGQDKVFELPVKADGTITINPGTPAGQILFKIDGGRAHFTGYHAEIAESVGTKNGVDQVRVLATYSGTKTPGSITDSVTSTHINMGTVLQPRLIDTPPVLPIYGRRGIEATRLGALPVGPVIPGRETLPPPPVTEPILSLEDLKQIARDDLIQLRFHGRIDGNLEDGHEKSRENLGGVLGRLSERLKEKGTLGVDDLDILADIYSKRLQSDLLRVSENSSRQKQDIAAAKMLRLYQTTEQIDANKVVLELQANARHQQMIAQVQLWRSAVEAGTKPDLSPRSAGLKKVDEMYRAVAIARGILANNEADASQKQTAIASLQTKFEDIIDRPELYKSDITTRSTAELSVVMPSLVTGLFMQYQDTLVVAHGLGIKIENVDKSVVDRRVPRPLVGVAEVKVATTPEVPAKTTRAAKPEPILAETKPEAVRVPVRTPKAVTEKTEGWAPPDGFELYNPQLQNDLAFGALHGVSSTAELNRVLATLAKFGVVERVSTDEWPGLDAIEAHRPVLDEVSRVIDRLKGLTPEFVALVEKAVDDPSLKTIKAVQQKQQELLGQSGLTRDQKQLIRDGVKDRLDKIAVLGDMRKLSSEAELQDYIDTGISRKDLIIDGGELAALTIVGRAILANRASVLTRLRRKPKTTRPKVRATAVKKAAYGSLTVGQDGNVRKDSGEVVGNTRV